MDTILITALKPEHFEEVKTIYHQGIATKNATFETECPLYDVWDKKHLPHSRLVAILNNKVVGWAALSQVSDRCVYRGVAEDSIYIATEFSGQGIGKQLLNALIKESEKNDIWTIRAGIFPENKSSIALHKKYGFREIGIREREGKMDNWWRDVLLMERRSHKVGID